MLRDKNGRFMSASPEANANTSQDTNGNSEISNTIEERVMDKFFALLWRLAAHGRIAAAATLLAVGGLTYMIVPSSLEQHLPKLIPSVWAKESDLFHGPVYLWTYDSKDNSVQHKEMTIEGSTTFHGKYVYRDTKNGGVVSGYRRIDRGTIGLEYASDDEDGNGLGYVTLRRLKQESEKGPPIWIGFETGHDCLCGSKIPHEGSFTSIPAILTTTPEPPEYLIKLVKQAKTIDEKFVMPNDLWQKKNS